MGFGECAVEQSSAEDTIEGGCQSFIAEGSIADGELAARGGTQTERLNIGERIELESQRTEGGRRREELARGGQVGELEVGEIFLLLCKEGKSQEKKKRKK